MVHTFPYRICHFEFGNNFKLQLKTIAFFVGNEVPKGIKKIYENIENGKKLTKDEKKTLGEELAEYLEESIESIEDKFLNIAKHQVGGAISGTSPDDDDEDFEVSEADVGDIDIGEPAETSGTSGPPAEIPDFGDEDLDKLVADELSSVAAVKKDAAMQEKQQETEKQRTERWDYNLSKKKVFIYSQIIYGDDAIDLLKYRIYDTFGIDPLYQHLCYSRSNPIFENDLETVPLGYNIVFEHNKSLKYRTNIFDLSKMPRENVFDMPIDNDFITAYSVNNSLIIVDQHRQLVADASGIKTTICCVALPSLYKHINVTKLQQEITSGANTGKELFNGLFLKYWPAFKPTNENLSKSFSNTPITAVPISVISQELEKINSHLAIISYVKENYSSDIPKALGLTSDNKYAYRITTATIHINSFIHELGDFPILYTQSILDLRQAFNEFQVSPTIPFLKFKDKSSFKIVSKVDKSYYQRHGASVEPWLNTEPRGLLIKYLIPGKKETDESKVATLNLFEDGRCEINVSWDELYGANESDVNKAIEKGRDVLILINNLPDKVFRSDIRIALPQEYNTRIVRLNVDKIFSTTVDEDAYAALRWLTFSLGSVVTFDKLYKSGHESQNKSNVHWRYLRSSNVHKKKIKNMEYIQNEILNNMEYGITFSLGIIPIGSTLNLIQIINPEGAKAGLIIEPGLATHLAHNKFPKLRISGLKSYSEMRRIFRDLYAIIYLAKNIESVLDPNSSNKAVANLAKKYRAQFMKKRNKAAAKNDRKRDNLKNVRKIRNLQNYDPALFDYDTKNGKYQLYSKLCQGNKQQPLVMTQEEYENTPPNEKKKFTEILSYESHTNPGTDLYYMCDDRIYKYPGFLDKSNHPNGFCLPCCHKVSSLAKKDTRNFKIYADCKHLAHDEIEEKMKKKLGGPKKESATSNQSNQSNKYVLSAAKTIEVDRWGFLPQDLDRLFNGMGNERTCRTSEINLILKKSICYLVYGVAQGKNGFINSIADVLNRAPSDLIAEMKKIVTESPLLFSLLNNGEIKNKFGKKSVYIDYISGIGNPSLVGITDQGNIEHEDVTALLSNNLLSEPSGLNIVVFVEELDGEITISCKTSETPYFLENLKIPGRKTIMILYSQIKKGYYPIYRLKTTTAESGVDKYYKADDEVIVKINDIFETLCQSTLSTIGINLDTNIINSLISGTKYRIGAQLANARNGQIEYVLIEPDKFAFPVQKGSQRSNKYAYKTFEAIADLDVADIKTLSAFVKILNAKQGEKNMALISYTRFFVKDKHIVGVLFSNNLVCWVSDKISALVPGVPVSYLEMTVDKINKIIEYSASHPAELEVSEVEESINTYYLISKEVKRALNSEKNNSLRNQIWKVLREAKLKTGKEFMNLNDTLEGIISAGGEYQGIEADYIMMRQVLRQMFINARLNETDKNEDLFNSMSFVFDLISISKIRKIIAESEPSVETKVRRIKEIVESKINKYINIGHAPSTSKQRDDLCSTQTTKENCEAQMGCVQVGNVCKVSIDKSEYELYLSKIAYDICLNDIKRYDYLTSAEYTINKHFVYKTRPNEELVITEIIKTK